MTFDETTLKYKQELYMKQKISMKHYLIQNRTKSNPDKMGRLQLFFHVLMRDCVVEYEESGVSSF